jgi:Fe-S cluster assembly iron-binding protein IscA
LALDEPKKTDERFDRDGVTFVIDKQLYEETKPITLDCVEMRRFKRFTIKSALDDKIDCGSCNC